MKSCRVGWWSMIANIDTMDPHRDNKQAWITRCELVPVMTVFKDDLYRTTPLHSVHDP